MAATFLAAADETEQASSDSIFIYGGFVAPRSDWLNVFTLAWQERVLKGRPVLPYVHMTDMRSRAWRTDHGVTAHEAESRIDEAARVIGSTGSLYPVTSHIFGNHLRQVFKGMPMLKKGRQFGTFAAEPDYMGFLGFAYGALDYVAREHPDADKVDFMLERKRGITGYIESDFYDYLKNALHRNGRGELVSYIGRLVLAGKESVPCQAADVMLWHMRRVECGEADRADTRRTALMIDGRVRAYSSLAKEDVRRLAERTRENPVHLPDRPLRRRDLEP